jgi:hypothetical protein
VPFLGACQTASISRVPPAHGLADTKVVRARYAIGGILVAALLALPASAAAGQGGQVSSVAAEQCAQQRADVGKRAFRKRYGARHAMRNCIRRNRAKASSALSSAAQECQEELAQVGAAEFIVDYAFDEDTVENAMSECIADTIDELLYPSNDDESEDDEDY